jgi:transcriptional regulator with XRE-family HTH domain
MTLTEWRKQNGLSLQAVAEQLGKTKGHIHSVENTNRATARLALDIERLTGGRVDAAFLNPEIAEARRQQAA